MRKLLNWLNPRRPDSGLVRQHYSGGTVGALAVVALSAVLSLSPVHGSLSGMVGGKTATPAPATFTYYPPSGKTYAPPSNPGPSVRPMTGTPRVTGIVTRDTGVDISAAVNAAADYYGLSAPGLVALFGTESNIQQYAPHYPIAGAGYCDYSAGLGQITVCTAAGLGVGDGSMSTQNINYVFWYEQADPVREVWLVAKLAAQFKSLVCWDFKVLYASWNLGPSYGCFADIYLHPTNWITIQATGNYAAWWNWVWAYHVTSAPAPTPTPKPTPRPVAPFPVKTWCQWATNHHRACPSYLWHGRVRGIANSWHVGKTIIAHCGAPIETERWLPRYRVSQQRFVRCTAWGWPDRQQSVLWRKR